MKGFGIRCGRQVSPAYCRRDNRVYRSCPLGGNWETCALRGDCLLAGLGAGGRCGRSAALTGAHSLPLDQRSAPAPPPGSDSE